MEKTRRSITLSDVSQNFGSVVSLLNNESDVVITQNNKPKYLIIDLEKEPIIEMNDNEKVLFVASRILQKHKNAFLELAK